MAGTKIPTYIISGFLGCGKTELINQFISQNQDKKIVVIENEVAEFGIDGKVSCSKDVKVIEINDGPISTVNLNNLKKVITKCLKKSRPDIILIEASGAANLDPILTSLKKIKLLEIYGITVIDAERFSNAKKLSTHTLDHVSQASVVLLNKCDLITKQSKAKQLKNITLLNKDVVECVKSDIDMKSLLKTLKPLELKSGKRKTGSKKSNYLLWKVRNNLGISSSGERHSNINAFVYEIYGKIDLNKLKNFFKSNNFPRAKGFVYLKDKKLYYFNVINSHFIIEEAPKQHFKGMNRIVLIGNNVFSRRLSFRIRLNKCVQRNFLNKIQNLFWMLRNQQRIPERVVYLE